MSLSPLSGASVPSNIDPNAEVRVANMANKQQKMEGAAAMALLHTAGQVAPAPPPPQGAAGGHINLMV